MVTPEPSETMFSLLRRFKKTCDSNRIQKDFARHKFALSKGERRRMKHESAIRLQKRMEQRYGQ